MPSVSAVRKAASRSGPVVPWVPARPRMWQVPHSCVNSALPFERSASSRPQAASGSATAAVTAAASSGRTVLRARLTGREHYPLAASITPRATLSQE
jgi:hypothetical protein